MTARHFVRAAATAGLAVIAAIAATVTSVTMASAQIETSAKQAILVDHETGQVLFEKNADSQMFPASMTKIMTSYLVFEQLRDGRLSMDDTLTVSEGAWRMGGSKMFVEVGDAVTIEDLLRGIIVQSGNDASIVVAEGLSGSEQRFGELMTERARDIGMPDTVFRNATGWPDEQHVTTARDMAVLARRLIIEFPDYYPLFAEKTYTYAGIRQGNRNPLLYKELGADGLKTGHTEASGFGLTASAVRSGRRLDLVVNGMESVRERSQEAEKLLSWGFREFNNYALFEAGETVGIAQVWLGDAPEVPLALAEDLTITLPRAARSDMKVAVVYDGPLPAPVAADQEVARLVITAPDAETIDLPLYATQAVGQLNFFGRIAGALSYLVFGASGG